MEATLERLEASLPGGEEPRSPEASMPMPNASTPETPSQSLGYKLANAGLNSVPTGVSPPHPPPLPPPLLAPPSFPQ
jgi:hypothetical protein